MKIRRHEPKVRMVSILPFPGVMSVWARSVPGQWSVLAAIILVGFLLRIYRIDHQSLWYDEAFSVVASRLPVAKMTAMILEGSWNHPPLHYYVLHGWMSLWGVSSFQARFMSAVFGTLSIVVMYLLARYLFDRQTATVAALLLTISQIGVTYSQEARPYAQLLFLVLCSTYLFVRALSEGRAVEWWAFVVSAIAMLHTNYYSGFVVLALLLFAVIQRGQGALRIRRGWLVGGAALALVLSIPWLWLASGVVQEMLAGRNLHVRGEQPAWFAANRWSFFTAINEFNNARVVGLLTDAPEWGALIGGILFTGPCLLALNALVSRPSSAHSSDRRGSVLLLALLWLLPMVAVIGLGLLSVQYTARYLAFAVAPYYILVAWGIASLRSPGVRAALLIIIVAWSSYSLRANYFVPYKENYRDALAYLAHDYREGDCATFLPFGGPPLQWSIYHGDHPGLQVFSPQEVAERTSCERAWVVSYQRVPWATERSEEGERMVAATHLKTEERQYFWVNVALYLPMARGTGSETGRVLPS